MNSSLMTDRRIGLVLLLLALLLLGWVAWDLWTRFTALKAATAPTDQSAPAPAPPARPQYNVNQIVNAHLFGIKKAKPKPVVQAPVQEEVKKTRLRLKLIGMVESNDDRIAHALLALENGRPKSYGIGDPIERTDAKVHSVKDGKVIIDRDGRLESIEMDRPTLADEAEKQAKRNGRSTGARRQSAGFNAQTAPVPRRTTPQPVAPTMPQPAVQPVVGGEGSIDGPAQPIQRVRPVRRVQRAPDGGGAGRRAPNPKFPF